LTINNKTVLPIVRGWEAPDGGVLSLVNVTRRHAAAIVNATTTSPNPIGTLLNETKKTVSGKERYVKETVAVAFGKGNTTNLLKSITLTAPLPILPPPPPNKTAVVTALQAADTAADADKGVAAAAARDAVASVLAGDKAAALAAAADAADAVVAAVDAKPVALGLGAPAAKAGAAIGNATAKAVAGADTAATTKLDAARAARAAALPRLEKAAELLEYGAGKTAAIVAVDAARRDTVAKLAAANDTLASVEAKVAAKLAAKQRNGVNVLIGLQLTGQLDGATGRRRLAAANSPFLPPQLMGGSGGSAALLGADGWFRDMTNIGLPDVSFTPALMPIDAVRDAVAALIDAKWARDGMRVARRTAVVTPLDAPRAFYEVRVEWRGGGSAALGSALTAVNDHHPADPCGSWRARAGFDLCGALDAATKLNVTMVSALADVTPPGTNAARFVLGRRYKGGALPSTVGGLVQPYAKASSGIAIDDTTAGWLKKLYTFSVSVGWVSVL